MERALAAGLPAVQFRERDLSDTESVPLAGELCRLCRRYGAAFFVNGRPDLARELDADGLHLPGRMPPPAGWHGPLSVAAHHPADLERAAALGATFALLSPLFATRSHPDAPPLGPQRFAALAAASGIPVLALGGLTPGNAGQARASGAAGLAAIDALLDTAEPEAAVADFRSAWAKGEESGRG